MNRTTSGGPPESAPCQDTPPFAFRNRILVSGGPSLDGLEVTSSELCGGSTNQPASRCSLWPTLRLLWPSQFYSPAATVIW